MESKQRHELTVFLEFSHAARLAVCHKTIEPRLPPEPDIHCVIGLTPAYFELGRLLDEGMQRHRLRMFKAAPKLVKPNLSEIKLPEREMLRKKLSKHYQRGDSPVDLVLYYDNESPLVGDVPVWDDDFWPYHAEHVMMSLIRAQPEVFRQVWVFDRHRCKVIWRQGLNVIEQPTSGTAPDHQLPGFSSK